MKYLPTLAAGLLIGAAALQFATTASGQGDGWVKLIDGNYKAADWAEVGKANWEFKDGALMADKLESKDPSYLVSKDSYKDFVIRAEFWAETDTNSGIFLRLSDRTTITSANSYEVNIWDVRPDPKYGTGAIVDFAAVPVPIANKAGGRWNTYEIEARGSKVTVTLNGVVTATMDNGKFTSGPFALQMGPGVQGVQGGPIKWRKVQVKAL